MRCWEGIRLKQNLTLKQSFLLGEEICFVFVFVLFLFLFLSQLVGYAKRAKLVRVNQKPKPWNNFNFSLNSAQVHFYMQTMLIYNKLFIPLCRYTIYNLIFVNVNDRIKHYCSLILKNANMFWNIPNISFELLLMWILDEEE